MTRKHYLSACGFFRGETPYLREWIEYHRLVGVEHFYMLANDPGDREAAGVLEPYRELGLATVFPWPGQPAMRRQIDGYNFVCNYAQSFWVAFIDLDEFLVPLDGDSVSDFLHGHEQSAGVSANWLVFGSSGHADRQPLQTDAYRRCADRGFECNRQVKTVVRPELALYGRDMHYPHAAPGFQITHEAGGPMPTGLVPPQYRHLRVNHYVTRSAAEFAQKVERWRGDTSHVIDQNYFKHYDRNECLDEAACRFLPALRERLAHPPAR